MESERINCGRNDEKGGGEGGKDAWYVERKDVGKWNFMKREMKIKGWKRETKKQTRLHFEKYEMKRPKARVRE